MNVRKPVDYNAMFKALDNLITVSLPQMELHCKIGPLVNGRPEKGTAVAVVEYLCGVYPGTVGFSPRNLRRMRELYRTYESDSKAINKAMTIDRAQSMVILEAELTLRERAWHIWAVK